MERLPRIYQGSGYKQCAFNKETVVTNQGKLTQIYTFCIPFSSILLRFFWGGGGFDTFGDEIQSSSTALCSNLGVTSSSYMHSMISKFDTANEL